MKMALVEFSESHEECIYSQVQFIKTSGHSVDLYINPSIEPQIDAYKRDCNDIFLVTRKTHWFTKFVQAFKLAKVLGRYDKVIFNTASSSKLLRNTVLILNFYKTECIGLLHNAQRLKSSFTQKLISSKIKKYFVLNDNLLRKNNSKNNKLHLQSFYPIFFPNFHHPISKKQGEIWLAIPGSIDYQRRNYDMLIEALSKNEKIGNLKILLLGKLDILSKDGKRLHDSISSNKIGHYFITYDHFVSNAVFHATMKLADYVLPVLKQDEIYLSHKISGSFNLAFAYKKLLISHKFFGSIPDIKEHSIIYDEKTLFQVLQKLTARTSNQKNSYDQDKWEFENQRKRYIDFLFL